MSPRVRQATLLLVALATGPACMELGLGAGGGSNGSSSGGSSGDDDFEAEAGTCNAWKIAYCDAVKVCGSVEEKRDCQDDAGYVVCMEDAPFASCATKLGKIDKSSECDDWPSRCEPKDIAERTNPWVACVQLYRAMCEWRQYCNPLTTVEDCEMALEADAPCSGYFAVIPDIAQICIDGYGKASCGEAIPPGCVTDQFLKK